MSVPVVAIDGPAGTGKSTTAREVARRLGWGYIDSGAFYRVAALLALRGGIDLGAPAERERLRRTLREAWIEQELAEGEYRMRVDGEDISAEIRSAPVTAIVSRVAEDAELREIVNAELRSRVEGRPTVIDGRDIGTVVFPDALLKVFLVASIEERARRRVAEAEPSLADDPATLERYARSLAERDRRDAGRAVGPLRAAPDAFHVDTSDMDIETQVSLVVREARAREVGDR